MRKRRNRPSLPRRLRAGPSQRLRKRRRVHRNQRHQRSRRAHPSQRAHPSLRAHPSPRVRRRSEALPSPRVREETGLEAPHRNQSQATDHGPSHPRQTLNPSLNQSPGPSHLLLSLSLGPSLPRLSQNLGLSPSPSLNIRYGQSLSPSPSYGPSLSSHLRHLHHPRLLRSQSGTPGTIQSLSQSLSPKRSSTARNLKLKRVLTTLPGTATLSPSGSQSRSTSRLWISGDRTPTSQIMTMIPPQATTDGPEMSTSTTNCGMISSGEQRQCTERTMTTARKDCWVQLSVDDHHVMINFVMGDCCHFLFRCLTCELLESICYSKYLSSSY